MLQRKLEDISNTWRGGALVGGSSDLVGKDKILKKNMFKRKYKDTSHIWRGYLPAAAAASSNHPQESRISSTT